MTDTLTITREFAMQDDLNLVHYSAQPVTKLFSVEQAATAFFKPRGLWLSVENNGDGWKDWCEAEQFGAERLAFAHDVVLAKSANIVRLSNAAEIDAFDAQFRTEIRSGLDIFYIDWRAVATKYQGIIIAPYVWERRLTDHATWYYAWDCASGCIWDAAAVESITLRSGPTP